MAWPCQLLFAAMTGSYVRITFAGTMLLSVAVNVAVLKFHSTRREAAEVPTIRASSARALLSSRWP